MDGGISEAALAEMLAAADTAAVAEGGAGAAAAGGSAAAGAGYGSAAAGGAGLLGAGASDAAGAGIEDYLGSGAGSGGLSGAGNTIGAANPELTTLEKMQAGFRNVGKFYNKLPPGVSGLAMQGLLGPSQPPQQTNYSAPHGGQAPAPGSGIPPAMPLPQVTPYAPSMGAGGNGDEEEMRRRLMLMLQMQRGGMR